MATSVIDTFFNTFNSKLEQPVQQHLKNVYGCLTLSTIAAAIGSLVHILTDIQSGFLSSIGAIALFLLLSTTPDDGKNQKIRLSYFLGFSFLTGMGLGPLLEHVIMVDPSIITTALIGTTIVFISFSLCSMLAERGSWLYLGGTLMSVASGLFWLTLANIFFRSTLLFQAHVYIGLVMMCAFVLYDTQLIIEKRRMGNKDFISHSLDLFIDFIGIFRRLLIILTQKEEDNQRRRKRND